MYFPFPQFPLSSNQFNLVVDVEQQRSYGIYVLYEVNRNMNGKRIVIVHCGAGGKLPSSVERRLVRVVKKAFEAGVGDGHNDRFANIARVLEDSPLTNTGYGSNICSDGTVRCDSSVVQCTPRGMKMGSVVCNSSRYPMEDALSVMNESLRVSKEGIVSPMVKVGDLVPDPQLVSKLQQNVYERAGDTIGVLLFEEVDKEWIITTGSSSGGNIMRDWRRIGSAGIPGSGCWTETMDFDEGGTNVVSIMVSGQGEELIKRDFARYISKNMLKYINNEGMFVSDALEMSLNDMGRETRQLQWGVAGLAVIDGRPIGFFRGNSRSFVVGGSNSRVRLVQNSGYGEILL